MPLHNRRKAGHHRGAAVQIRRGQRPCKPCNVKAPKYNAAHCGRKPGVQHAAQFVVCRLLVARPKAGAGVLPGIPRAAEQHLVAAQKCAVSTGITLRVPVFLRAAGAAVVTLYIVAVNKFTAVGFKAVHPHVQQVLPFGKPALPGGGVGKIGDHRPGEPVPRRDGVRRAVGIFYAQAAPYRIFAVKVVLRAAGLVVALLFVHRYLPQHKVYPGIVQLVNHPTRVLPVGTFAEVKILIPQCPAIWPRGVARAIPCIKGGFVTPRFHYQYRGGVAVGFQ